jgi:hypothetical protein
MTEDTHEIVGELTAAQIDLYARLPTITMTLRQCAARYSGQPVVCLRSYGHDLVSSRQAMTDYAALVIGMLYNVEGAALSATLGGGLYLHGVCSITALHRGSNVCRAPDDIGLALSERAFAIARNESP